MRIQVLIRPARLCLVALGLQIHIHLISCCSVLFPVSAVCILGVTGGKLRWHAIGFSEQRAA